MSATMRWVAILGASLGLAVAAPAWAQLRVVPATPDSEASALRGVAVFLLNEGADPLREDGPRQITVTAADGTRLVLERVPGPTPTIAPGAFARQRYVPVALAAPTRPSRPGAPAEPVSVATAEPNADAAPSTISTSNGTKDGFFDRFTPHEPIYGAFGLSDAGGKVQFSFAFQPFGGDGALSHVRFAYTQTMFWAVDQPSGPFRTTTYSPELYVEHPVADNLSVAVGYRHDSNGGDQFHSVDLNRVFISASRHFDLGDGWYGDLTPRAWFFTGKRGNSAAAEDYYGDAGIGAAIGRIDGLKLEVNARGSLGTGRGGAELFASYPLARLDHGIGFFLFGQAFTGYGEAVADYRVSDSHARLGIALTR